MRILTWNIGRHPPESLQSNVIGARIADEAPDIAVLTEAHSGSLDSFAGHVLDDRGVMWGGETESERKVVLWSREPWRDRIFHPELSELGGIISAVTDSDLGPARVIGVCMPYPFAWPRGKGLDKRPPPWSQFIEFAERLAPIVKALDPGMPAVIAGDFNQTFPIATGSWQAHHKLKSALGRFGIITQGDIASVDEPLLCHVAVNPQLRGTGVRGIDRFSAGKALSDHSGIVAEIGIGGIATFD